MPLLYSKLRLSRLALSYWSSANCLRAWALMLLLTACTIIIVVLNMLLNKWQVGFYAQLQQYNFLNFIDSLQQFTVIAGVYILTSGYQSYCQMSLEIQWRHYLTDKYITMWLTNQSYYRLNLINSDMNPDQRISEDVRLFVNHSIDLSVGLLRHITMLLVFSVTLWNLSGIITFSLLNCNITIYGYLFWLALLCSALGTWFVIKVGRPLIPRNVIQQSKETLFRSYLTRIKESAESIALYGGEKAEQLSLETYFQKIINNYRYIAKCTQKVTFLSTAYSQLSTVFAFLIASPRYFNHELELGELFEISGAYWYVHSSLAYIIDSFSKIALWKAVANRLNHFSSQMSDTKRLGTLKGVIIFTANKQIQLKKLTILSLDNRFLIKNLSLTLQPHEKLLISGPIGCGKTTLLRTIAGLWPYFTGTLIKTSSAKMMFLPQKPYTPIGSLRNALFYPNDRKSLPDNHLNKLLESCNLSRLIDKLDEEKDWGQILSLGEQQCLAFCRAILQQPDWLFLDEATSNMDKQTEQKLYRLLAEPSLSMTIISVGHRETLRPFHTFTIYLDSKGTWDIATLENSGVHSAMRER